MSSLPLYRQIFHQRKFFIKVTNDLVKFSFAANVNQKFSSKLSLVDVQNDWQTIRPGK